MWESESQKYLREKEAIKRREQGRNKILLGLAALLTVSCATGWYLGSSMSFGYKSQSRGQYQAPSTNKQSDDYQSRASVEAQDQAKSPSNKAIDQGTIRLKFDEGRVRVQNEDNLTSGEGIKAPQDAELNSPTQDAAGSPRRKKQPIKLSFGAKKQFAEL